MRFAFFPNSPLPASGATICSWAGARPAASAPTRRRHITRFLSGLPEWRASKKITEGGTNPPASNRYVGQSPPTGILLLQGRLVRDLPEVVQPLPRRTTRESIIARPLGRQHRHRLLRSISCRCCSQPTRASYLPPIVRRGFTHTVDAAALAYHQIP